MKINSLLLIVLFPVCVLSCATESTYTQTDTSEKEIPEIQLEKKVSEFTLENLSLYSYPSEDSLVVVAVSPRFLTKGDEMTYALASAARQVSIYYGAHISYQKLLDENIIGIIQLQKIDIGYDQDLAVSFLDKLKITKEIIGHDYYAAEIKLDGVVVPDFPLIDILPGTKPLWINTPPQFEGFVTGVGISGQMKSVYDSWEQSDKLAMAEITDSISSNVQTAIGNIERSSETYQTSTSVIKTFTVSDVSIKGLYIISRWREPDHSYYYSLAISRKP